MSPDNINEPIQRLAAHVLCKFEDSLRIILSPTLGCDFYRKQ